MITYHRIGLSVPEKGSSFLETARAQRRIMQREGLAFRQTRVGMLRFEHVFQTWGIIGGFPLDGD
ncbi:hypothetical protein D1Y84_14370 [Acidipila sp. EB88]|nr:hypothetical protein D1Y84_14370 [Acidipila sp. EB88]